MKRLLALAAATVASLFTATAAQAGGVHWSVGINLPPVATVVSGGPAYYPAPYYGAPAYPAPVYGAPARWVAASRQVAQGAAWVDAPVQAATVQKLEDIILTKARDLRRQAIAG